MYICKLYIISTCTEPPVIAPPDQPPIITDDGIEVMVGYNDTCINNTFMGTVNFTCVVVSGKLPVTIRWQVNGEDFMNNSHSEVVPINNTISKLIVGVDTGASIEQDVNNNYTCIASNEDGRDSAESILSRCGKFNDYKSYKTVYYCYIYYI